MGSPICTRSLATEALALRCYQESQKYLDGESYDESCCLELFRRALRDEQEAAWRAIYVQFFHLLQRWVYGHPRFHSTEEEGAYLINIAFSRFWHSLVKQRETEGVALDSLPRLLQYLKSCVYSAVEDAWRRQQRQPPRSEFTVDELADVLEDDQSARQMHGQFSPTAILHQAMTERLNSAEEEVVARLSWQYGLAPRQVREHHPEMFPTVQRVYDLKKNILDRLLRDPYIQNLRKLIP